MIVHYRLFPSVLALAALQVWAADSAPSSKWSGDITLKALEAQKGGVGLDYRFAFKPLSSVQPVSGATRSAGLEGSGFITPDSSKNTANAISTQLTFDYANEFDMPAGWGVQPTPEKPGDRPLIDNTVSVPGTYRASLDARWDATQDLNNSTLSIGPKVSMALPWWGRLIDFLGIKTRPVFLSVGYDYLVKKKYDAAAKASGIDQFTDRLDVGAGTLIVINGKEIEFTYEAQYALKNPLPASSLPRWADFFAVRFGLFDLDGLGIKTGKFAIIYSVGRLPPVYDRGQALGGGIYLKF